MPALVIAILTALPQVTTGITHLINWLSEMRKAGQQNGQWTAEMEQKFMDGLIARASSPAYQPDPK